jgi:hypothetical protein
LLRRADQSWHWLGAFNAKPDNRVSGMFHATTPETTSWQFLANSCRLLLREARHSLFRRVAARSGHRQRTATGKLREPNMTKLSIRIIRQAGSALAFAVSFSALSTASFAFSAEAQQMCTGDAMRLCSSEIPNVARITSCMIKQRTSLSSGCRTVLDRDLAAQQSAKVAAK